MFIKVRLRLRQVKTTVNVLVVLVSVFPINSSEWFSYGADVGSSHYSELKQIDKANVSKLIERWRWKVDDPSPKKAWPTVAGDFQATPISNKGIIFVPTPLNRVVALNADTGIKSWEFDPHTYLRGPILSSVGSIQRGLAIWTAGPKHQSRIISGARMDLWALALDTGIPIQSFGHNGKVDVSSHLKRKGRLVGASMTSPPLVVGDIIIAGYSVSDMLRGYADTTGEVLAFDVVTGALRWKFETVKYGATWSKGKFSKLNDGHVNVWAPISADSKLGLVYLPVSAPGNDYFGGARLGDNLYSDSLVCLDIATGKKKWSFQTVHHDLWDYDLASAPILADGLTGGSQSHGVIQLTKSGFIYAFDRSTGKPLSTIVEREVSQSVIPGEVSSRTQPFVLDWPVLCEQGFDLSKVIDSTLKLSQQASKLIAGFKLGPLFTPPSVEGTISMPGVFGCVNWGGGAYHAARGILVVKTSQIASLLKVVPVSSDNGNAVYAHIGDSDVSMEQGFPISKPPYGELIAIDINSRTVIWRVPAGDWPFIRQHPLGKGVKFPKRLGSPGRSGPIVTSTGLVFAGNGDSALRAYSLESGVELWSSQLGADTHGTPMTCRARSGNQMIIVAAGQGTTSELIAFSL